MEVQFTADQEARLAEIARGSGAKPEELVRSAALRLLEEDAVFVATLRAGLEEADRGEFIEEDEMDERVRRLTGS